MRSTGVVASDGTRQDRIIGPGIKDETRTPLGETLVADLRLTPTGARTPLLIIDGLRLSAFMPGTDPAPLTETGCHMLTDGDRMSIADLPDDVIDAHDRLVALGICHDFIYTYRISDPASGDLVATERWCTPPPVQAARSYTRAERKPRTDPSRNVQAWPYEAQRDGQRPHPRRRPRGSSLSHPATRWLGLPCALSTGPRHRYPRRPVPPAIRRGTRTLTRRLRLQASPARDTLIPGASTRMARWVASARCPLRMMRRPPPTPEHEETAGRLGGQTGGLSRSD